MKIQLERLPHQIKAIEAINNSFKGIDYETDDPDKNYIYANPILKNRGNEKSFIDIKMETGTGKTFVYTQMMYEMHKQGVFKFVIVVPTPSIKEGTKKFITSDYAKQYFSSVPGYENVSVQLNEINAGDFSSKKSRRRNFPAQLSEFIEATNQNVNQIQVLLINSGMLNSKSMKRSDYDQTLLGGETNPTKAISDIRPVVIMDEPHRFPRNKVMYKAVENLNPQLIVRFGATFPRTTEGRGKNKKTVIDYYRGKPQFNLNAIDSFNQGLVKGIDISYPDVSEAVANNLYKVKDISSKQITLHQKGKDFFVPKGGYLSDIDEQFTTNLNYQGSSELSNGLKLEKGMQLIPGTFTTNYQDKIISEAIDKHFEAEEKNFMRQDTNGKAFKIKTLSLFFIDDISSFRGENHSKGWLAEHFENMLTKKIKILISKYQDSDISREKEYCNFLQATLNSLKSKNQQVYAGYFSEDRGSGDEAIQQEVDDILTNKEKLLSFKDDNGNWITRRFLFSKWTLREGWDNPNVFVIAKLRTSGSEVSKIQEVGRGLRLPVDENGHRLQQSEYESRLSFLIGYDERDFAQTLVSEVNQDAPIKVSHEELTNDMINLIVNSRKKTDSNFDEEKLLNDLTMNHKIINLSRKFLEVNDDNGNQVSGYDELLKLYPELDHKVLVAKDKIRDKNSPISTKIKLRKKNWNKLKSLWIQLANRKMIRFDNSVVTKANHIAEEVFSNADLFVIQKQQTITDEITTDKDGANFNKSIADYNGDLIKMNYRDFLLQLVNATELPLNILNQLMIKALGKLNNNTNYINEHTLNNLIKAFNRRFYDQIKTKYDYVSLNFSSSTSIYNSTTNEFVDNVSANDLGVYVSDATKDDKFLYDRPPLRYDSTNPELEILNRKYGPNISVFGKLPKRSIKIPRYDKGTTTPDFIFRIDSKGKTAYLIVETKAENMRIGDEQIKVIQESYFSKLKESGVYYKMATSEQQVHDLLLKIEDEI